MKSSGWINFEHKLPYQTVFGGQTSYDYLVIVVIKDVPSIIVFEKYHILPLKYGIYRYALMSASMSTELYQNDNICRDLMIAWASFDKCTITH